WPAVTPRGAAFGYLCRQAAAGDSSSALPPSFRTPLSTASSAPSARARYRASPTTFGGSFGGQAVTNWLATASVSLIRSSRVGFSVSGRPSVFVSFIALCFLLFCCLLSFLSPFVFSTIAQAA